MAMIYDSIFTQFFLADMTSSCIFHRIFKFFSVFFQYVLELFYLFLLHLVYSFYIFFKRIYKYLSNIFIITFCRIGYSFWWFNIVSPLDNNTE